jgi:hypothetical protein
MEQPTRKTWLRFSIRTLLVAITVIACGLGWVMYERGKMAEAFAVVQRHGGSLNIDIGGDLQASPEKDALLESRPAILRWVFGDVWPSDIGQIHFSDESDFADEDLAMLVRFRKVKIVTLQKTKVTGPGLVHLHELPDLRILGLNGTPLTDEGLQNLNGLPISFLDMAGTKITDAGLAQLKNLPKLSTLHLDGTQISNAGLLHLKELKSLENIYAFSTKITDDGKTALCQKLPNCKITPPVWNGFGPPPGAALQPSPRAPSQSPPRSGPREF